MKSFKEMWQCNTDELGLQEQRPKKSEHQTLTGSKNRTIREALESWEDATQGNNNRGISTLHKFGREISIEKKQEVREEK